MAIPIFPQQTLASATYGTEISPFAAELTTPSTTGSATVLPVGWWFVVTGASQVVQYSPNGGGTYHNIVPASSGGVVFSDGATVQIKNTTGGTTATYVQILGGAV